MLFFCVVKYPPPVGLASKKLEEKLEFRACSAGSECAGLLHGTISFYLPCHSRGSTRQEFDSCLDF